MYVHVNPSSPDRNGPGSQDIWLIDAEDLDAGSTSYSVSPSIEVKRYLSNITFDWTTNGACIDLTPNGGALSNADKGLVYRDCYPATPGNFNVHKLYKLKISDEFGMDECSGTVKVIPDLIGEALAGPIIHFVIPNNGEYISIDKNADDLAGEEANETIDHPFMVLPNPGKEQMQVYWTAPVNESASIRIVDLAGRTIVAQDFDVIRGENTVVFDMGMYPSGVYAVVMQTATSISTVKWIKE
jgi:hypothetical protein